MLDEGGPTSGSGASGWHGGSPEDMWIDKEARPAACLIDMRCTPRVPYLRQGHGHGKCHDKFTRRLIADLGQEISGHCDGLAVTSIDPPRAVSR